MTASETTFERTLKARCRFCAAELRHVFVDLGMSPLCETLISPERLNEMEEFFPLRVYVCEECLLVQLKEYVAPDVMFGDSYPYYSSYSNSWVEHARQYVLHVIRDHGIGAKDFVVELASNDGYLLQHFVNQDVRCLGVEPAKAVADAAIEKGIPTVNRFFNFSAAEELRAEEGPAQLIVGNNVLAHIPDLDGFVAGVKHWLGEHGFATFEFPHLTKLMELNQFDTIYHEHFSYFSFSTVRDVFIEHGLRVFDVLELQTHGGSLRVYVCHSHDRTHAVNGRVDALLDKERACGYRDLGTYLKFSERVHETKRALLQFLIAAKDDGKIVVGYGAPGKGNTLLNFCGIRTDFLDYTVDRNPHKQGNYTVGTRIPIHAPAKIFETKPDYVLILPWNFAEEVHGANGRDQRMGRPLRRADSKSTDSGLTQLLE